jgi:glycosyltransferase involved in cell wall biosynthesis
MIEALACGVPVVAYPFGSVPEIIDHGKTGFLVKGIEGAAAALKHISDIDRGVCRGQFEKRFSARRMARDYLRIYQRMIKQEPETIALTDGDLSWMKLEPPSSTT